MKRCSKKWGCHRTENEAGELEKFETWGWLCFTCAEEIYWTLKTDSKEFPGAISEPIMRRIDPNEAKSVRKKRNAVPAM